MKQNAVRLGTVTALALASLLVACATTATGDAPEAALESVDELDEGTTWNGMTQILLGKSSGASALVAHTISGSGNRGGGGCVTVREGSACTSDATCTTAAKAKYGSLAYGYCYQSQCYDRPGGIAFCSTNQNRWSTPNSPHSLMKAYTLPSSTYAPNPASWLDGNVYALGCMSKSWGPSGECGGTDPEAYMRTMSVASAGTDPLCDVTYTVRYASTLCHLDYSRTCTDGSTTSGVLASVPNGIIVGWGQPAVGGPYQCGASDHGYTWKLRKYKSDNVAVNGTHSW